MFLENSKILTGAGITRRSIKCVRFRADMPVQDLNQYAELIANDRVLQYASVYSYFQGIKLKMDNDGNILVRRASSSPVFVRSTTGNFQEDNCFSSEVVKVQGQLEADKPVKVGAFSQPASVSRNLSQGANAAGNYLFFEVSTTNVGLGIRLSGEFTKKFWINRCHSLFKKNAI